MSRCQYGNSCHELRPESANVGGSHEMFLYCIFNKNDYMFF